MKLTFPIGSLGFIALAVAACTSASHAPRSESVGTAAPAPVPQPQPAAVAGPGDLRISGPYVHENLTVFLVHGPDRVAGKNFITLQEAIPAGKVVVHETGNVNELSIENVSSDEVYIQSGDIVRGGRQDRTIAQDVIVPAKSGKLPLASFCVESGRWTQRSGERADAFNASEKRLATKDLNLAAKRAGDQQEVWQRVAEAQKKLDANCGGAVEDARSASSLELALENKQLVRTTADYLKDLAPAIEGQADAIGFAFAINGKLNSADVYATGALFRKLWPKLIDAAATEAVSERDGKKAEAAVTADAIAACMKDAEAAKTAGTVSNPRCEMVTKESDQNFLFETRDREGGAWLHRNYVTK